MASLDKRIGDNVTRLRAGRSQRDVAGEMKKRGWKWSHVTLVSIESGDRPLRLSEAVDLAQILGTDVRLLFEPTGNLAWNEAYLALSKAHRDFEAAISRLQFDTASAIMNLGDVELTPEQEDDIADDSCVTALSLVFEAMEKDGPTLWQTLLLEDVPEPVPESERLRRNRRRLRPIAEAWENDHNRLRIAYSGEHPEAP